MSIANKKAFTLLELVIGLVVISIGIVGIISMMQGGLRFVDRTRQDVVAINLAREGVESVFSLRNSNRLKWSGKRDECRLIADTFANYPNTDCENYDRLGSGYYVMNNNTINSQNYFSFTTSANELLDLSDGLSVGEEQYALCETGTGWIACPGAGTGAMEGLFFRQIVGKGLYRKDVAVDGGQLISCDNGADTDGLGGNCDEGPQEYRFCVRVAGLKQGTSLIELCSVLTNFE